MFQCTAKAEKVKDKKRDEQGRKKRAARRGKGDRTARLNTRTAGVERLTRNKNT